MRATNPNRLGPRMLGRDDPRIPPTSRVIAPGPWAKAAALPHPDADACVVRAMGMVLDNMGADFPEGLRHGSQSDRNRRTAELIKLAGMMLGQMPFAMRQVVRCQYGFGHPPMTIDQTRNQTGMPRDLVKRIALEADEWMRRPDVLDKVNKSLREIAAK